MTIQFTKTISTVPNNYNIWKYYTCPIENFRGALETQSGNNQYFNNLNLTSGDWLDKLAPDGEHNIQSLSESETNPSEASSDLEPDTYTGEDDFEVDNGRPENLNLKLEKISDERYRQDLSDQCQHSQGQESTSLKRKGLDEVLKEYLKVLDSWQQEAYNIRIAHHKIWKNSRVSRRIKQHRAGSRVESQTRILSPGKVTDVDYMFELDASPSISGKGAVNEYDTVPCLRLSKWPKLADSWKSRGPYSERYTFNSKWKEALVNVVPLFLVPTGNPLSRNKQEQFRLSFSMVEIKCFDQLTAKMRTNYGIAKYAFKQLFCSESYDLLSSYHIKTIFLWIVEELSINDWDHVSPINFVRTVFSEMKSCILKQSVRHFFVNGCNIFPSHKFSEDNISFYNKNFERDTEIILQAVTDLLRSDLDISSDSGSMLKDARSQLRLLASQEIMDSYIGGYLTRLLSMTTFSLFENELQGTLMESIDNIRTVFSSYQADKHLKKIVNAINIFIKHMLEMEDIIKQLSARVPYIGKLSYKFAAVYLIHGYRKQFKELGHVGMNIRLTIPDNINLDSFNQRMFAKNFDLR
ncbi:unnamed protein product [Mytilus edulis]|uniref:Mab-21-like HhH/H2TH-like domain-containing protein n=1 Tax=Mytilus edulis TaxID=6550 RepID=A0A8S3VEI8_MYTED|nr:unnamed protein product [Mytilus edulis]